MLKLKFQVLFSHVEAIIVKNVMHLFINLNNLISICLIKHKKLCEEALLHTIL